MADKNDKLKQLLKQAGADKPAEGFTDSIMSIIEADVAREAALKTLLKQQPAEGPSFDFTASVMRQVSAQRKPLIFQPIISKKAWYVIATVFMLMIAASFVGSESSRLQDISGNSRITSIMNEIHVIPAIYVLAAVSVAILLLGDYLLTQRKKAVLN